jgi:3-oxoacyl-[acyl-carrier protein] reductase
VIDEFDVEAMVGRAVQAFGHVDILINNAAAPGADRWIWEQTLENWNATIAIDLTAATLCTREVLKQSMLERGSGVILNFSSAASFGAPERKTHNVSAKAALRAFTQAVAREVGPKGIRCNCVVPGAIDTDVYRNWVQRMADEESVEVGVKRASLLTTAALREISSTEDQANLALFLASDECTAITGQSIVCDGGVVMLG